MGYCRLSPIECLFIISFSLLRLSIFWGVSYQLSERYLVTACSNPI